MQCDRFYLDRQQRWLTEPHYVATGYDGGIFCVQVVPYEFKRSLATRECLKLGPHRLKGCPSRRS